MSILASDAFTDSDGVSLPTHNANWATLANFANLSIKTNGAGQTTLNELEGNIWTGLSWPNDQYSKATFVTIASLEQFVVVRGIITTRTYYAGGYDVNDWNGNYHIWINNAGVSTDLADSGIVPTAGDIIELDVQGTSLTLKKNGVPIAAATDSALVAGTPGIASYHNASGVKLFDDWEGGDLAAAAPQRTLLGVGT